MSAPTPAPDRLLAAAPAPVLEVLRSLRRGGHEAVLVGGCVRDPLRGVPAADWDVATAAGADALLAIFPRAVPIGREHGTVMVPTAAGPVDVTPYRGNSLGGGSLASDLAHRDFTLNAMAFEPERGELIDPHGGRNDLEQRHLRAVGVAAERLAEDPLRALRAARLVAQLDLTLDAGLEAALPDFAAAAARCAAERVRAELERLLASSAADRGLELLRRSGLEAQIVPGARDDAARVVGALPPDLVLRWAAWLRGARAGRILARWRVPTRRRRAVERLLALHPVDAWARPGDAGARALRRRAGDDETVARLLALREAELAATAPEAASSPPGRHLAALREALARCADDAVRLSDLAIDGREVMAVLGLPPGPAVGRALEHLLGCVLEDPSCNEPEALRARARAWARQQSGEGTHPAGGGAARSPAASPRRDR